MNASGEDGAGPHEPERKRVKPTSEVEARLLISSRRRCCLCVFLDGDSREKEVQLAHIDRDASNSKESNLAPLCLRHHDRYDSTTSQSKGLTEAELLEYKRLLFEGIQKGEIDISNANFGKATSAKSVMNADIELFKEFVETFPSTGLIWFLERNDFGSSFNSNNLDGLSRLIHEWSVPEREFLNPELEDLRKKLLVDANEFANSIGEYTFPDRHPIQTMAVELSHKDPDEYERIRGLLNAGASRIVKGHQALVRAGKRILDC
jgi:hypothetical protein